MSTANLSIRVDAELKKEVENCLEDMGLNMSTAITQTDCQTEGNSV